MMLKVSPTLKLVEALRLRAAIIKVEVDKPLMIQAADELARLLKVIVGLEMRIRELEGKTDIARRHDSHINE